MNAPKPARPAGREPSAADAYDLVTLLLHWVTAILVVVLFATALIWDNTADRALRHNLESLHVSLGILFTALVLVRVAWRLTAGRRLPADPGFSGLLSRGMYWTLYLLLAAEIVLGFVLRWYQGETFSFFGLFDIPNPLTQDRAAARQFGELHEIAAWAIMVLAAGHSAAALFHRYVLRDHVLQRMLFHRRAARPAA